MAWKLEFGEGAKKDLKRLDTQISGRIMKFLGDRVAKSDDPRGTGGPLEGPELGKYWRYRVGDYRIICKIQDEILTVLVVGIGHRSKVYR